MKYFLSVFSFCIFPFALQAQYAPQAGIVGSDAVHKNSIQIVNWAVNCELQKGWMDIGNKGLGNVTTGDSSAAVGMADNLIVSLGDSGVATLHFNPAIVNGAGADFAVFENGFLNAANNEEAFLELAFVEVSSDGVNFFRFPATSNTQILQQITGTGAPGTGDYINARQINNLAGKYVSNYGTPFDLEELKNISGLNVNAITHVRLVDVIGSLNGFESRDKDGRKVNDPYPTPFPTSGFDLDAVAVLHQSGTLSAGGLLPSRFTIYPNPVTDKLFISGQDKPLLISITDATGKILFTGNAASVDVSRLTPGGYFIMIKDQEGRQWTERFIKL
ncbi:MAG TPA: T9SS type A sorting domain-containing protein [Flavipsychrobacter sp.]|nr:T9SS type A sorting domain-containing protein [Flavipsychrobacter sp.]